MITNFKRLSESLDKAAPAPGTELLARIRAEKERIENEIALTGASYVKVDGQRFKVSRAAQEEVPVRK